MRIGVLVCDEVQDRFRPIAGDYGDMFRAMVTAADAAAEVVTFDVRHGDLPPGPDHCDAWMLTGSSASVFDDAPWIASATELVRGLHATGAPTVGVCFGHQLLAHALGGRTERMDRWGVGALSMDIVDHAAWMDPPLRSATLLYSHQDQVVDLPPGGRVLATAPHCPVAMLAVGDDLVGIQAHPEYGAPYVRVLLEDRADRIGEADTAAALRSLETPTDGARVARWLLAFLRSRAAARGTP